MGDKDKTNGGPMNGPKLREEFISIIDGKPFVKYAGLVDLAHQRGGFNLTVDLIQLPSPDNGSTAVCKAVLEAESFHCEDYGDASPASVNKSMARHLIRMAATRAKARVLRDYTNVGMTAAEEIGGDDAEPAKPPAQELPPQGSNGASKGNAGGETQKAAGWLRGALSAMSCGNEAKAEDLLQKITAYEGANGPVAGIRTVDELVTRVNSKGIPARFWRAYNHVKKELHPAWSAHVGRDESVRGVPLADWLDVIEFGGDDPSIPPAAPEELTGPPHPDDQIPF